ncbi:MAG: hypothetical protein HYZ84_00530 [Candidatus Omnitrophica bacterium]|nr:hypothetical protein [Candidatus Omnitrophota bacterium]
MTTFAQRIVGAAKLDPQIYEEVEHDPSALKQAAVVVILSSVAGGVGLLVPGIGIEGLFWGIVSTLLGWVIWAAIIYGVGGKLMAKPQTSSSVSEVMRVIGFASTPGLIRIFGLFPPLRVPIFFIAMVWMLVAMVLAVRQALDYESMGRAVAVVLVGWACQIALILFLLWANGLVLIAA